MAAEAEAAREARAKVSGHQDSTHKKVQILQGLKFTLHCCD